MRRKDDHIADLFAHPITARLLYKESMKAGLGHISGDIRRIETKARLIDRILIKVGGKDL